MSGIVTMSGIVVWDAMQAMAGLVELWVGVGLWAGIVWGSRALAKQEGKK